jgi:RND family efflux transporter MFP subunit
MTVPAREPSSPPAGTERFQLEESVVMRRLMPAVIKFVLPVIIVAVGFLLTRQMIANRPEPRRFTPPPAVVSVEATRLVPRPYQVTLEADGTVEARTQTTIIPEVAGRVVEIASESRSGAFFEAGDLLVRIDPRNYELAVTSAEAEVAQAQAALTLELAEADVVAGDWRALGREAPPLGLREPQIAAARANLAAAEARLERARVDLERTVIRAPYAGRVLSRQVDIGQYVTVGTPLGTIYSVERAEVRLPLSSRELAFVDLPSRYRGESLTASDLPPVELSATIGGDRYVWDARIVRSEGAIDTQSRRLFVIAEVDDPYASNDAGRPPLRVGQFVQAAIRGRELEAVFVLPRTALRGSNEVLIVTSENTLERREVHVAWMSGDDIIVDRGLAAGEVVNVTPLAVVADGTPVRATIDGRAPARRGGAGPGTTAAGAAGGGGGRPSGTPGATGTTGVARFSDERGAGR